MPIANARMYSVTPAVGEDWRTLLAWVLRRAGLADDPGWSIIEYAAPAPLSVLWARDDLGLAMMCGLPFGRLRDRATLIAAPVPSPARYQGRPVYFSDLVVRADSAAASVADTFGGVIGYTVPDSLSGCIAPRAHLRRIIGDEAAWPYRAAVNGLIHARGVIEALVAGTIDIGSLDSWYHDLLRRHDPAFAAQVRTLDSTVAAPIPPWIATAPLGEPTLAKLRAALLAVSTAAELAPLLDRLLLSGFHVPDPNDYDELPALAAAVSCFPE